MKYKHFKQALLFKVGSLINLLISFINSFYNFKFGCKSKQKKTKSFLHLTKTDFAFAKKNNHSLSFSCEIL